nr:MAG TPA: hypothetical protein [Caudoviricetes sp.]
MTGVEPARTPLFLILFYYFLFKKVLFLKLVPN